MTTALSVELTQVYKCTLCGNMTEVVHVGGGKMTCCNQPMNLLKENTSDGAKEKHVPVIEVTAEGVKVSVGSIAHPMEEKHYIEWIELIVDGKVYRQHLQPGEAPEAFFAVK